MFICGCVAYDRSWKVRQYLITICYSFLHSPCQNYNFTVVVNILYAVFHLKSLDKIQVWSMTIMSTLYEDLCTFVISLWILLGERNIVSRLYRENQISHFVFSGFFSENCAINEIMWKTHKLHCSISTPTLVMWTYHNLTLCIHCLSCLSNVRHTVTQCILHGPIFFAWMDT